MPTTLLGILGKGRLETIWRTYLGLGAVFPTVIFWLRTVLQEGDQFKRNNLRNIKNVSWLFIIKYYWRQLLTCSMIWFIYNVSSFSFALYSSHIVQLVTDEDSLLQVFGMTSCIQLFLLPGSLLGAFARIS